MPGRRDGPATCPGPAELVIASVATIPIISAVSSTPIIPAVVASIASVVAIVVTIVVAIIVAIVVAVLVWPVITTALLVDPDFLQAGVEATIVIAILVPIVVDDYQSAPALELPVPARVAPAVITTEHLHPYLAGPITVVAIVAITVTIPRLDAHVTAYRTPSADPDICANALCAGRAS